MKILIIANKNFILLSTLLVLLLVSSCNFKNEEKSTINFEGIQDKDITIGQNYTLKGKIISGEWELQIALPLDYDNTKDNYPVIYILDGQYYFNFAVGALQRSMIDFGTMPNSIIVGIKKAHQNHYVAYGSKSADQFLEFFEQELFPFMSDNFRVHHTKTIMGWHYTASFVVHALVNRPELFDNYIPSSPFAPNLMSLKKHLNFDVLDNLKLNENQAKKQMYFGTMTNERSLVTIATQIDSILKANPPKNLEWDYHLVEPDSDLGFSISVYRFLNPALKYFYKDYTKALNFKDYADFKAKGGLPFVEGFYKQRAVKYGGSSAIASSLLVQNLFRIAIENDDINLYNQLMEKAIINNSFSGNNINAVQRILDFYVKNDKHKEAIEVYESILEEFPRVVGIYSRIGDVYADNNQKNKAIEKYKTALNLAKLEVNNYFINELNKKINNLSSK